MNPCGDVRSEGVERPSAGMDDRAGGPSKILTLDPLVHPDPQIHRVGFPLDHPYVERCWAAQLGPTSVLLLRRLPELWQEQSPAEVPLAELGRILGVGPSTGRQGTLVRTLERLVRFQFATWQSQDNQLGVYTAVRPVPQHQLRRLPTRIQDTHKRLLAEHLDQIAASVSAPTTAERMTRHRERLQYRDVSGRTLRR